MDWLLPDTYGSTVTNQPSIIPSEARTIFTRWVLRCSLIYTSPASIVLGPAPDIQEL